MQIRPTDRRRSDFEDDVGILGDIRDVGVDDLDAVGALPGEGLHPLLTTLPDLVLVLDDIVLGRAGVGLETEENVAGERIRWCDRTHIHTLANMIRLALTVRLIIDSRVGDGLHDDGSSVACSCFSVEIWIERLFSKVDLFR